MIGRPALTGDTEDLRTAVAVIAAIDRKDAEGVSVLDKYADPTALLFGFAQLMIDALGEPATTDVASYVDRLFARLDQGQH
jgi:hypothetical protein